MPYNAMMQGLSTFFATAMTVTVISFPTPRDLYQTVFPPTDPRNVEVISGGVEPELPKQNPRSATELVAELDACRDVLSGTVPLRLFTCETLLVDAAVLVRDHPEAELSDELRQKADLVAALYCRHEWAEAMRESDTFDLDQCQGQVLALAD